MFQYDLAGRQVVLVLDAEVLPALAPLGISASPTVATVHSMEPEGLWLENPRFGLCPPGMPRLHAPGQEEPFCHAHVFVPRSAIVSVAVFPGGPQDLEERPDLQRIGFVLAGKRKGKG